MQIIIKCRKIEFLKSIGNDNFIRKILTKNAQLFDAKKADLLSIYDLILKSLQVALP